MKSTSFVVSVLLLVSSSAFSQQAAPEPVSPAHSLHLEPFLDQRTDALNKWGLCEGDKIELTQQNTLDQQQLAQLNARIHELEAALAEVKRTAPDKPK